jgi:hypothetical protein
MKAIKNISLLALSVFIISAAQSSTKTASPYAYDPSGTWAYEVAMSDATLTGNMVISKNEAEYEVTIESNIYGTLELEDVEWEANTMEANVEVEGDIIDFEFEFEGDTMEGAVYTPDGGLDITAERISK